MTNDMYAPHLRSPYDGNAKDEQQISCHYAGITLETDRYIRDGYTPDTDESLGSLEMQQNDPLPDSWDCHVHVLDPQRFPYRHDRTYTPYPASLSDLTSSSVFKGILIVQASVEDGPDSLPYHLREGSRRFPDRIWRGSVISTTREGRDVALFPHDYLDELHAAGVRSVRIQSGFGSFQSDRQGMHDYVVGLAQSYCVASLGWSISIQQPLDAWASMSELLQHDERVQHARFVAEHLGSVTPQAFGTPEYHELLALLGTGRLWVKVSALHRRSPGDIYAMESAVKQLVHCRPDRMVFGTDWPHTNPAARGPEPQPPLQDVDTNAEMEAIRAWVGDKDWRRMLSENPPQLFQ